jgi:hypothetical protein
VFFFGRRRTAEEQREERKIKSVVRDIAYARGTTPRKMRKQAKAAARSFIADTKREQKYAKQAGRPVDDGTGPDTLAHWVEHYAKHPRRQD